MGINAKACRNAIPNMPDARLLPLAARFAAMLADPPV
jgi:hypothetical protein